MVSIKPERKFKSKGERRIGNFLDENQIKYRYEAGVLINDYNNQPRIWYPDFHLTEYGTYIEYYGLAGNPDYEKSIRTKESAYSKNSIDVISIYPWMFAEKWQGHIMTRCDAVTPFIIFVAKHAFAGKQVRPGTPDTGGFVGPVKVDG